jgi:prepilin-type processing-associated H-X9-DG protein
LLVVIGIIALLISILLPSLGRARQQATMVSCQSSMRQVYNALLFYANDNKGALPTATDPGGSWGVSGTNPHIYSIITQILTGSEVDPASGPLSQVLRCPEMVTPDNGFPWSPGMVRTVGFHPRAFPGSDQVANRTEWPQRKLSSIRKPSEKIAFWDGSQWLSWNMTTFPSKINLDGWQWNWGRRYTDPPSNGDYSNWDGPANMGGANRDGGAWEGAIRFRHMKNTFTVVGFFDGHVESRRIRDIRTRELMINR